MLDELAVEVGRDGRPGPGRIHRHGHGLDLRTSRSADRLRDQKQRKEGVRFIEVRPFHRRASGASTAQSDTAGTSVPARYAIRSREENGQLGRELPLYSGRSITHKLSVLRM